MKEKENNISEQIDHEFKIRDELVAKRKEIKTFDDLVVFLKDVNDNYGNGYGDAPRAMAQAALAVVWYLSSEFGITGFQAGFVMWDFIQGWTKTYNKCGLKLVDYDDMLYPQYDYKFEKAISSSVWENLQKQAKINLESNEHVADRVIDHWKSIADGKVPFGYAIIDD